jgi:indoleamine 2,3-dioxygenase
MSFLLEEPQPRLPESAAVLDHIATELPTVNAFGGIVDLVGLLRDFDPAEPQLRPAVARAFMILSFLAHSYVWSEPEGCDAIPELLAVPWSSLGSRLGLPPVLSYTSYVLHNRRPLFDGTRLVPALSFTGSSDEAWFIDVHQRIEAAGAPVVVIASRVAAVATEEDAADAAWTMARALAAMCNEARTMARGCDPYIYFQRIRKFLYGWKWNPIFGDRRMRYLGVETSKLPNAGQYSGESGSQSPLLPLFDALLGVAHQPPFLDFSREMRLYMEPRHRSLIDHASGNALSRWAERSGTVRAPFRRAVEALHEFRTIHLDFAQTYIIQQAERETAHDRAKGTGGSEVVAALSVARDSVARRLRSLPDGSGAPGSARQ